MTTASPPDTPPAALSRFKNTHLSVSRLKLYEQCPRAFELRYIRKLRPSDSTATAFGTLLHAVLERLFRWVLSEQHSGRLPEDLVLQLYREEWAKTALAGAELYNEGLQILREYVSRHPVTSYLDVLDLEVEFNLTLGEFTVNGRIDRVDKLDDTSIAIVDYKSNRVLFSRDEVDADLQMSVYGLAAREMYPWAERIVFRFRMLRHGQELETTRSASDLDHARDYVIAIGRQTEDAESYPPKLNTFCGYCDHRKDCVAYQHAIERGDELVISYAPDSDALADVARAYNRLGALEKIIAQRRRELGEIIRRPLEHTGQIQLDDHLFRLVPWTKETRYDPQRVLARLTRLTTDEGLPAFSESEIASQVFTVDPKRLEAFLDSTAMARARRSDVLIAKAEIDTEAEKIPGAPRLLATPLKGSKPKVIDAPTPTPAALPTPASASEPETSAAPGRKKKAPTYCVCGWSGYGRAITQHRETCADYKKAQAEKNATP